MSFYYKENNDETTQDLFNKKTIYRSDMIDRASSYSNLVNFNFGEKFFYGRVSRLFVPLQIQDPRLSLKAFKNAQQPSQAIKFVVDAFEALSAQFRKCAFTGKIASSDPYLSNLSVYKAYQSPNILYQAYRNTYFQTLAANFKADKLNVKNFDEFIIALERMLESPAYAIPFTRTAFMKSRRCPMNVSGLVVEIADLDPANDQDKIDSFVGSLNWEFYVNACRSYGFMVDQEVPWRLVADIGSSPMLEYAAPYGVAATDLVLNSIYEPTSYTYFPSFKYDLLRLYNLCKEQVIVELQTCGSKSVSSLVTPVSYTIEQIEAHYSELYFFQFYCKIRFWEDESPTSASEQEQLINDCIEIYRSGGIEKALYIFERIVNKPFDYRGSLSYISKEVDAKREAAFQEG